MEEGRGKKKEEEEEEDTMLYLKILLKITPNTLPIVSPLSDIRREKEKIQHP